MKKICLVFGGDSLENEISILTALKVKDELKKHSYSFEMVYLDHDGIFYTGEALLNKNNYYNKVKFKKGYFIRENNKNLFRFGLFRFEFDIVLLLSHGLHCEDGTLCGFFNTLKIPCICPSVEVSSLVQNKSNLKRLLSSINIPVTKSITLKESEFDLKTFLADQKLSYPLICKPNYLGSSIGVSKVNDKDELITALKDIYKYDKTAIVEECVDNLKEINIAITKRNNEILLSECERVNDKNKILSFNDKYDNYSFNESHIIPADVPKKVIKQIKYYTKKAFLFLNMNGVLRFDYLYDEKTKMIYLNEINAIPGSLSYYLFEPLGIRFIDLIEILIEQYYLDFNNEKKKILSYREDFISSLKEK